MKDVISKAEVLHPEYKTKPRIHYIALPRRFVAGAVFDPVQDECIEGAIVTLVDSESGEKVISRTDQFGDFWLHGLKEGTFSLTIEKDGYFPVEMKSINTTEVSNLGDIEVRKK